MKGEKGKMTDEEIIEVVSVLKANDKTMKDSGISDNLWGKAVECITFLQFENAELKSSLTHANEECLKWHERTQNLLKDSSGSISGYEKKISDLQTENAALRERLEKAVELPCKVGDTVYLIRQAILKKPYKLEIEETKIEKVILTKTGWKVKFESNSFYETSIKNFNKTWFTDKSKAEACLAELKGQK